MQTKNPYHKYVDNNVHTAPKEELTLMLYDGALKFANQAIAALDNKDYVKTNEFMIRVQDIFRELQLTLNFDYEISNQMNTMYDYIISRSIEGNISKDREILNEVRDMAREFRDTWKEAIKLSRMGK